MSADNDSEQFNEQEQPTDLRLGHLHAIEQFRQFPGLLIEDNFEALLVVLRDDQAELDLIQKQQVAKTIVASLPNFNFPTMSSNNESDCAVCRESYKNGEQVVSLPCCHQFHLECVQQAFLISLTCPLCKTQLPLI